MDEAQLKQLRTTVPIGEYRVLDRDKLEGLVFSSQQVALARIEKYRASDEDEYFDRYDDEDGSRNEDNLLDHIGYSGNINRDADTGAVNDQNIGSLIGEIFDGKRIIDCIFKDTELYDTSFIETIIEDSKFYGSDLTGSRFDGAEITEAKFYGANFTGSRFDGAEITDSRFTGANFTGSRFDGAEITDSRFTGANFTEANFTGAKFCESSLYNVRGLEDALNITSAKFDRTTIDETNYEIIRKEFLYEGITLDNGKTKDGEILFEILPSNPDDLLDHIVSEIADLKYGKGLTWNDTTSEMNEKYDTDFKTTQVSSAYHHNKDKLPSDYLIPDEEE